MFFASGGAYLIVEPQRVLEVGPQQLQGRGEVFTPELESCGYHRCRRLREGTKICLVPIRERVWGRRKPLCPQTLTRGFVGLQTSFLSRFLRFFLQRFLKS